MGRLRRLLFLQFFQSELGLISPDLGEMSEMLGYREAAENAAGVAVK